MSTPAETHTDIDASGRLSYLTFERLSHQTKVIIPMRMAQLSRGVEIAIAVSAAIWNHPANRDHKFRAIIRGIKWQVKKRLVGPKIRLELYGAVLTLPASRGAVSDIFYFTKYFEWENLKFCERFVRDGDIIIDGGANIGMFTYALQGFAGGGLVIHAFEPASEAAQVIETNAAENFEIGRVVVHNTALGAMKGNLYFRNDLDVGSHVLSADEKPKGAWPQVEVQALDDLFQDIDFISLVKLDVEGSEFDAIKGAERLLSDRKIGAFLIEGFEHQLAKMNSSRYELFRILTKHNFSFYRYDPSTNELNRADVSVEKPDVLAIHESFFAEVSERLLRTP